MKNLVAGVSINNDEVNDLVNDLNNEDAIHLNDGFGDIKDFVIDRVQHEEDNQQHHFDGPIEIEGEQHNHVGGPDKENVIADHNTNFDEDADADEDNDHNEINVIHDEPSHTSSDTNESSNTTEANPEDTEYLSDKDDNDDCDATPKLNYLTRNLQSYLDGIAW